MLNKKQKILVLGCGGLGSEIIKLLKEMNILLTIVDFDKIDISNLNRQFFYTKKDVNKSKAEIISKKLNFEDNSHSYLLNKLEDLDNIFYEQFDVIFCCLDSVSSRIELNYKLENSKFFDNGLFVDCGVENFSYHIKKVDINTACLYCINTLYKTEQEDYLCSLSNLEDITLENRNKFLRNFIFKMNTNKEELEKFIPTIVNEFNIKIKELIKVKNINIDQFYLKNKKVDDLQDFTQNMINKLMTTKFEVEGIIKKVMPNICTINSICASNAIIFAFTNTEEDFMFFNGLETPVFTELKLEKDKNCFVCNKK